MKCAAILWNIVSPMYFHPGQLSQRLMQAAEPVSQLLEKHLLLRSTYED